MPQVHLQKILFLSGFVYVWCFVLFFLFFLQICDFHVSDRQTILVLDNDSPSKYNMQFLNDDFIMETKLSKVTSP